MVIAVENCFEHNFQLKGSDDVGAAGSIEQVQPAEEQIAAVGGLAFDLDIKAFLPEFQPHVGDYARRLLPRIGLRQTSAAGNLHAIVMFDEPVPVAKARKVHKYLRRAMFCDPNASFTMCSRCAGSVKVKGSGPAAERFTVLALKQPQPVSADAIIERFSGVNDAETPRLNEQVFRAVVPFLKAPDGTPLNSAATGNGVCPLHGSGVSRDQAKFNPADAAVICFADCATQSGQRAQRISLQQILARHVLTPSALPVFADATTGRPRVINSRKKPRNVFRSAVMDALATTRRLFTYLNGVYEDTGGELRPVESGSIMGRLVSQVVDVVEHSADGEESYVDLSEAEGNFILFSRELQKVLPCITLRSAMPVFDQDWRLVKPGYNAGSGIYYEGPAVSPAATTPRLTELLEVFRFKRPSDRAQRPAGGLDVPGGASPAPAG
jgi:hypothetical protein